MHGSSQHTSCGPGRSGRRRGLEHLEHYRQLGDSGTAVCDCAECGNDAQATRDIPLFMVYWFITIFLLAYVVAWLYSSVRATRGAGPGTALTVGLLVGFAAGFPMNLSSRHVGADRPPLTALVDARPLAGSDHGVAGGRLDLQRLTCFFHIDFPYGLPPLLETGGRG